MSIFTVPQQKILSKAMQVLETTNVQYDYVVNDVNTTGLYLCAKMAEYDREVFGIVLLNSFHSVLSFEAVHFGDLNNCSVSPRQVVRAALDKSDAVLFVHNHPSQNLVPSEADIAVTKKLVKAFKIFEIKVLDHFITAGSNYYSFAQNGLM